MSCLKKSLIKFTNSCLLNEVKCNIIHTRPKIVMIKSNLFLLLCQYPTKPKAHDFIEASTRNSSVKMAARVANTLVTVSSTFHFNRNSVKHHKDSIT